MICRIYLFSIQMRLSLKTLKNKDILRLLRRKSLNLRSNQHQNLAIVGASEATVKRRLGELKKEGIIIRVGGNKTGHWVINKAE